MHTNNLSDGCFKRYYLIIGLCIIFQSISFAQVDSIFWFAVPEVDFNHGDRPISLRIVTYDENVNLNISIPANPGFTPLNYHFLANTASYIDLTLYIDLLENTTPNAIANKGVRIVADGPLSVMYELNNSFNPDIFVLKGRNALGTQFYTPFQTTASNGGTAYSSFDIVATENNTQVVITPSNDIVGHSAGVPFTITLQRGQTYSARAAGQAASQHLNGSRIQANKPIAVTIKDDTMSVPSWGSCFDIGGDQIVAQQNINTEYIIVKGFLTNNDRAYVVAPYNNTDVFIDGNPTPVTTLQSGQTYSMEITQPYTYIRTSNATYVMHLTGFFCELSCPTLPALKSSCEQKIAFTRFTPDYMYALIITKQGNETAFKLNGTTGIILSSMFSPVPGTNNEWMAARVDLSSQVIANSHNIITNDSGSFILGVLNGSYNRSLYGYVSNYSQINLGPDIVKCANVPAILDPGPRNQYLWSTGDTTPTIAAYAAGTYWVKVTTNGCVMYDTINITNKPDLSFELGPDTSYCTNDPYFLQVNPIYNSYLWNTGASGNTLTATNTNKYWLRTTDNVGCTYTDTISIHINNFQTIPNDTICRGDTVQLVTSAALAWHWDPAVSISDTSAQSPFIYPATTTKYFVDATFPGNTPQDSLLHCYDSTGIVVIHHVEDNFKDTIVCFQPQLALDAPPGYSQYVWSTGASTQSISAVNSNIYWVKMIDKYGCFAIDSADITIIPDLNLNILAGKNPLCNGDVTTLTASSSYPAASLIWNTGVTNHTISISPSTTTLYQITGMQDGCKDSISLNVVVNPLPNVQILAIQDSICYGDSINLMALGGSSYNWGPPVNNTQSTNWVKPLVTTTYSITGTDQNNCIDTDDITIAVVNLPNVAALVIPDEVCKGDTVAFTASGATQYFWVPFGTNDVTFTEVPDNSIAGYLKGTNDFGCINIDSFDILVKPVPQVSIFSPKDTICKYDTIMLTANSNLLNTAFLWSTGSTNQSVNVHPVVSTQYTVTGSLNGCSSSDTINIGILDLPNVQVQNLTPSICKGLNATVTASGALSYIWQPSGSTGSSHTYSAPSSSISGWVKGTDIRGCADTANFTITVKPIPYVSTIPTADTICSGETITLQCSSAVLGAQFTWTTGELGNSIEVHPTASTQYSVTSILNGCSDVKNVGIFVYSLPNVQITATNDSVCLGDSIHLQASGASNYLWAAPINSSLSQLYVKPLVTTTYQVTGTDTHNCSRIKTQKITVVQPPALVASVEPDTICPSEPVTFQASGASSYLWMPYATSASSFTQNPSVSTNVFIKGYNQFGCLTSDTFYIYVKPVPQISITAPNDSICRKDSMQLTANSNMSNTTYTWSTGQTTTSIYAAPTATTYYTVTGKKDNCTSQAGYNLVVIQLPIINAFANPDSVCPGATVNLTSNGGASYLWTPGNYTTSSVSVNPMSTTTYTATGFNIYGCKNRDTVVVLVSPKPILTVTATPDEICAGSPVLFNVASNQAPTNYTWFNFSTASTLNYSPLSTGYFVVKGNHNGCIGKDSVQVVVHPLPNVAITASDDTICQYDTVSLNGSGALNYEWQPLNEFVQNTIAFPLTTTTYYLTGTDINNCQDMDSIKIFVKPPVSVSLLASADTLCYGDSLNLSSTGTSISNWLPFMVSGNPVTVMPELTTQIILQGIDINGCIGYDTTDVFIKPRPQVSIFQSHDSICRGETVMLIASADITELPFTWSTGVMADTIFENPSITTQYLASCTFDGCIGKDSAIIEVVIPPSILITPINPEICETETLKLYASSSSPLTTYQWSTGDITDSTQITPAQSLTVYLTTNTGICSVEDSVYILVDEIPHNTFIPSDPWICSGDSIVLTAHASPPGTIVMWEGGLVSGSQQLSPPKTTQYKVKLINKTCESSDSVYLRVNYAPDISLGPDQPLCEGSEVVLFARGVADSYNWSNGSTSSFTNIQTPGTYWLIAIRDSCITTDTIELINCSEIWVPNAFTPDDDNINDVFKAKCHNIEEFHMIIYDRWGTLIFESYDCETGWDGKYKGKIARHGVYTYIIEYMQIKDYVEPNRELIKGSVLLLK